MSQFDDALSSVKWEITKYDPKKVKSITLGSGVSMTVEKFATDLRNILGREGLSKFPEVVGAAYIPSELEVMVREHAEVNGTWRKVDRGPLPASFKSLTLNLDMSMTETKSAYFLTTPDERISIVSGMAYIRMNGLKEQDASAIARHVIKQYMPREKSGVTTLKLPDGVGHDVFNSYYTPLWMKYAKTHKVPDELPALFVKLVNHIFPRSEERRFFFSWLYHSMFERASTYLVLCGAPGTGKNRLKIICRALHGHENTADGKKSNLVERFNSQFDRSTLVWFDELHYDMEMENVMKELQNDSISIERKGVDATHSSRIHASFVISNNKPRDNYIAFDARKFVPLVVTSKRLERSMLPSEIDLLTKKVENTEKPGFDIAFIAQIAMWIKRHGKSPKWPTLEYRGPMFWTLAHTSMSRWQKKAASIILETEARPRGVQPHPKKGFLWSEVSDKVSRKNGDRSLQFPDYTTVRAFFEVFRDGQGRKAFETFPIEANIMGDFYVRPLFEKINIVTEASLMEKRSRAGGNEEEDYIDL